MILNLKKSVCGCLFACFLLVPAAAQSIQFESVSSQASEDVTTIIMTLTRSEPHGRYSWVAYTVSGTASGSGVDYVLASGYVYFKEGDKASDQIQATIVDDTLIEPDETIVVTLSDAWNAQLGENYVHTHTIIDNDQLPEASFADSPYITSGETGTFAVSVQLNKVPRYTVSVDYSTANGTAIAGSDYAAASGTLTWAAGGSTQQFFEIALFDDNIVEGEETIQLYLSGPESCSISGTNPETLTIQDDDTVDIELSSDALTVPEGGTNTFQVRLTSQPQSETEVQVERISGDEDISIDYGSSLHFSPLNWDVFQTVTLSAAEDSDRDNGEAVFQISIIDVTTKTLTATEFDDDIEASIIALTCVPSETTQGGSLELSVEISDNRVALTSFGLDLVYNPAEFSFQSLEAGALTADWSQFTSSEDPSGRIRIEAWVGSGTIIPVSSSGSLLKLNLMTDCIELVNEKQGNFRIENYIYDLEDEFQPSPANTSILIKPCPRLGDVNGDGNISPGDSQMTFEAYLGLVTPGFCQTSATDINCDGRVTPGDAQGIFDHYLGKSTLPECCAEFSAGSSTGVSASRLSIGKGEPSRELIAVPSAASPDGDVAVSIIITNPQGIRTFSFDLSYPPDSIEYRGMRQGGTSPFSLLHGGLETPGLLRIAGEAEFSIAEEGVASLAVVHFKLLGKDTPFRLIELQNKGGDILEADNPRFLQLKPAPAIKNSGSIELGRPLYLPDRTVRLPVLLNQTGGIKSFGMELEFSADQLEFVGLEPAGIASEFLRCEGALVSKGKIRIGGISLSRVRTDSTNVFFEIVFFRKSAGGTVEISELGDDIRDFYKSANLVTLR